MTTSLAKSQIIGIALLALWVAICALASRNETLKPMLLYVGYLGPVLVGFVVAKIYRLQPIFGAFLVGVAFVILVVLGNLLVNRGAGLLYVAGVIVVPALTMVGGMVGKIGANSQ